MVHDEDSSQDRVPSDAIGRQNVCRTIKVERTSPIRRADLATIINENPIAEQSQKCRHLDASYIASRTLKRELTESSELPSCRLAELHSQRQQHWLPCHCQSA